MAPDFDFKVFPAKENQTSIWMEFTDVTVRHLVGVTFRVLETIAEVNVLKKCSTRSRGPLLRLIIN